MDFIEIDAANKFTFRGRSVKYFSEMNGLGKTTL